MTINQVMTIYDHNGFYITTTNLKNRNQEAVQSTITKKKNTILMYDALILLEW